MFGHKRPEWVDWLNGLRDHLGGVSDGRVSDRMQQWQVGYCVPLEYALTEGKVEERNPCLEGEYAVYHNVSVSCEPSDGAWSNFNESNSNNSGGGGGSVFTHDFASEIFTSNNFFYQMSECPFSSDNPPLIYQTSGHGFGWAGQFMNAANYYWNTTTQQKKIDMFMYAFRMSNNIPGTANSLKWTDFFSHYGAGCGSGCLLVGTAKLPNNQTTPVKLDVSTLYLETSRLPDVTGEVTLADGTWSQYGFYNYVNGQVGSIETIRLHAKQTSNISLFENMIFGW